MGIKRVIKAVLSKVIPKKVKEVIVNSEAYSPYINMAFSQEGEDLILSRLFESKKSGFYVDIGAHHPFRFSNTYKFYREGWSGINLDPLPGAMKLFDKYRSRDINIEVAISNNPGTELTYYVFDDPALNSFNEKEAKKIDKNTKYNIISTLKIKTERLADILSKTLPKNTVIDFFSIDVEGLDLSVLQSNNWELFRPTYIVMESFSARLVKDLNPEIAAFLNDIHYELIAKTVNSWFFLDLKNSAFIKSTQQ
jgi:FkbM family methyltransferase